ncbi:CRTAC1 family protein [Symbioplanes lichenis]|uniref:CRTAC1 family protein n=1 Tax=Symbioplanes lichenis TaxID=1629072 RepID=UPI0027395A7E|nr:CRTAC1 family protein [Actinoplanes lichenis]
MPLRQRVRNGAAGLLALVLCVGAGLATRLPSASAGERAELAGRFAFTIGDVNGDPPGARTVRRVQPQLEHIRTWISAVGASGGLADLDNDGRAGEACLVDPRDDSVSVLRLPTGTRLLTLEPTGLSYRPDVMAPMGCLPGDLNEDGWSDVLVYFWGRPPVAYLRRPGVPLSIGAFTPADVVSDPSRIWNSTTANLADLDGDGRLDLIVGNYFPAGARVLDPAATDDPAMQMQESMSNAANAGENVILRLAGVENGVPRYEDQSRALTEVQSKRWTLATGAQDLDGDALPELYVANDFGPDYLLHNRSVPGRIAFTELRGQRLPTTPKSKALGNDSFKSMGVTFTDLNADSRPDLVVSNITTPYGLQESNFAFVSTGTGPLTGGRAPYRDDSEPLGLARTGWAWDVKAGDFDGDGTDELVQAVGFVTGTRNRWAQLQELALTNDDLVRHPAAWPDFVPGDDVSGHQRDPFLVRGPDGRFVDVAAAIGLANPGPSRGIALGDIDRDGRLDALISNQFARSQLLHNRGPHRSYLGLRLLLPATPGVPGAVPRPAVGAAVTITTSGGPARRAQLFPANGHTGVNAPELLFGLGAATGPVTADITWRDAAGPHTLRRVLAPGWHDVVLQRG